jgi:crossover junction endodeoxyribonuclease RuvC
MEALGPSTKGATKILGIDPGSAVLGFGVILSEGTRLARVDSGVWRRPPHASLSSRLAGLSTFISQTLVAHRPDAVALESAFVGTNCLSALRLGEARGAIMAACGLFGIEVHEYPTATVKKALTGRGGADKDQVRYIVQQILGLKKDEKMVLDESDALAVAIKHAFEARHRSLIAG